MLPWKSTARPAIIFAIRYRNSFLHSSGNFMEELLEYRVEFISDCIIGILRSTLNDLSHSQKIMDRSCTPA